MTQFLDVKIYTSKILDLCLITNLNFVLNIMQALSEFKSAPLLPLIINPETKDYTLSQLSNLKVVLPPNFSSSQVPYMNSFCRFNSYETKLCCNNI